MAFISKKLDVSQTIVEIKGDEEIWFNDSKRFVKPRVTIDIVMIYHQLMDCLEIIGNHPQQEREAPRIYLNVSVLHNLVIDQKEVDRRVEERLEMNIRNKKVTEKSEVVEAVEHDMLMSHLLSHLRVVEDEGLAAGTSFTITLLAPGTAKEEEGEQLNYHNVSAILPSKPSEVIPCVVFFPKRFNMSTKDFMSSLHDMSQEIRQLAHVASVLVDNIHVSRAQVRLRDYAPARKRWLTAIKKVQNINMVNKVRVRLDAIAQRDARKAAKDELNAARAHPRILRRTLDHQPSEDKQVVSPSRRLLLKPATLPHIQFYKEEGTGDDRRSPCSSPLRSLQRSSTLGVGSGKRRERALTFEPSPTSTAGMQRMPFHDKCDRDKLLPAFGLASSSSGGSTTGRDSPTLVESFVHTASRSPRPVSSRAYDPSYALAVTMKCDLPSP
eukprot:gene1363-1485_t